MMKAILSIGAILFLYTLVSLYAYADEASDEAKMLEAIETLRSEEVDSYVFAMAELMEFGPAAVKVLPELVKIAGGDGDTQLTYPMIDLSEAFTIMFGLGERGYGEKSNRYMAATALSQMGKDVIPLLVDYLDSEDPVMKVGAAYALTGFKDFPVDAMPKIYPMFHSDDPLQRITAAQVVSRMQVDCYSSLPLLEELLKDDVPQVRAHAVNAIGFYRDKCDVFEPIRGMLDDDVPEVRAVAIRALGMLDDREEDVAPLLIEYLEDESFLVRDTALTYIGPTEKDAVPILISELKDNELELNDGSVIGALGIIGPDAKDAIPLIILRLHDEDYNVRQMAAYALGDIGIASEEVIDALTEALDDEWNNVVRGAAESLGGFGPAAEDALPRLLELAAGNPFTNPGKEYINFEKVTFLIIASTITNIDPEIDEGLLIAKAALQDEDDYIARNAIVALGHMGARADDVVPILIGLLENDDEIRAHAVIALLIMGPPAVDALPMLRKIAREDPNIDESTGEYYVRKQAKKAIEKIRGKIALSPPFRLRSATSDRYGRGSGFRASHAQPPFLEIVI